ncbi:MAG: hypothetical protein NVS3B20_12330 [Polyangiales bacterium]
MGCVRAPLPVPPPPKPAAGVATSEHITASPKLLELEILVRPHVTGTPRVEFEVSAKSDDLPRRFVVQHAWAGEEAVVDRLGAVSAFCDGQPTHPVVDDLVTHVGWTLPHRCQKAKLVYSITGAPNGLAWGNEYDVVATDNLVTAIGETALLLPDCPDDTRTRVRVQFDLTEMPQTEGVYSLGEGSIETTTRSARHAYFAIGKFLTIRHQAGNLSLEARFAGTVHFNTAAASRDLIRLLSTEQKLFREEADETLRMLFVGMPAAQGASHGTSLTSSAALWIDGFAKWGDQNARLSAHEMFHLYNGQIIRRRGPDAQTYFFSEGFTEHYTDEIMLRAGIWSPREWFEAVRFRLREYHAHPDVETPNDKADMKWGGTAQQLPYLRGSLIAEYVDSVMRKQSKGKRSLDDFMRMLVGRARAHASLLDVEDVLRLIEKEVGPEEGKHVRRFAVEGLRISLPKDAYGACVEVVGRGKDTDLRVKPGVDLYQCVKAGR